MTRTSPEALIKAMEENHKKVMQSKESALKFLKELGVLEEDETEDKTEDKTEVIRRKSK